MTAVNAYDDERKSKKYSEKLNKSTSIGNDNKTQNCAGFDQNVPLTVGYASCDWLNHRRPNK